MQLSSCAPADIWKGVPLPKIRPVTEWISQEVASGWQDRDAMAFTDTKYGLGLLKGPDEEPPEEYATNAKQRKAISERGAAGYFPILALRRPNTGFRGRGFRRFHAVIWPRDGSAALTLRHGTVYWCENLEDARLLQIAHRVLNPDLLANVVSSQQQAIIGGVKTFYQSVAVNPLGSPIHLKKLTEDERIKFIAMLSHVIIKGASSDPWVAVRSWDLSHFRWHRVGNDIRAFPVVLEKAVVYNSSNQPFAVYRNRGVDEWYADDAKMKKFLGSEDVRDLAAGLDFKKFVILLEVLALAKHVAFGKITDVVIGMYVFTNLYPSMSRQTIAAYMTILEKLKKTWNPYLCIWVCSRTVSPRRTATSLHAEL